MARYKYNYYREKIGSYKWAIGIVVFLAIIAIALSIFSSGFRNWNVTTWFNSTPTIECEHVFEDGTCAQCGELEVVEEDGSEVEEAPVTEDVEEAPEVEDVEEDSSKVEETPVTEDVEEASEAEDVTE